MSTTTRTVIAGLALALALTGCTAAPSATEKQSAPVETEAAPLVPDEEPAAEPVADDATYLAEVRLRLKGMDSATDEQLIAAGHEACEAMAAGTPKTEVDIIQGDAPGEVPGDNDLAIAFWAATTYCPEFD